jgi:hypothetical protein
MWDKPGGAAAGVSARATVGSIPPATKAKAKAAAYLAPGVVVGTAVFLAMLVESGVRTMEILPAGVRL